MKSVLFSLPVVGERPLRRLNLIHLKKILFILFLYFVYKFVYVIINCEDPKKFEIKFEKKKYKILAFPKHNRIYLGRPLRRSNCAIQYFQLHADIFAKIFAKIEFSTNYYCFLFVRKEKVYCK